MRYHSNPKPVRIRFESGGEEHFSLDSLLACFNPFDIINKKNELLRWLSTQQEEDSKRICKELESIEFNEKNMFTLYKTFFKNYIGEKSIGNLIELLLDWSNEVVYRENFEFLKQFCYADSESLAVLYEDPKGKFLEEDWLPVIEKYVLGHYIVQDINGIICKEVVDQPLLLYNLGELLLNKENYSEAEMYFQFANQQGVKQAAKRLKAIRIIKKSEEAERLLKDFNKELVNKIIQYGVSNFKSRHWGSSKKMVMDFYESGNLPKFNDNEWMFFSFTYDCLTLQNYSGYNEKEPEARKKMSKYEKGLLNKEAAFITNLIRFKDGPSYAKSSARAQLFKLDYYPAKYTVDYTLSNPILDNVNFRDTNINLRIRNFLKNMISFR